MEIFANLSQTSRANYKKKMVKKKKIYEKHMIIQLDETNISKLHIEKYCELLRSLSNTIYPENHDPSESLKHMMKCTNLYIFVYESLENPLGTITCFIEPKIIHDGAKVAHIEDVVVHPDARGQKIATSLVRHVQEFAQRQNCYKVLLHCHPSLIKMYESMGFSHQDLIGMRCDLI